MIDVLYIYKNSKNNGEELKYSLRSLEKYVSDYGRIFICGDCPDFVDKSKVIHIPARDIGQPMINHWWKVREAITKTDISADFVLMYDDIFFVKPTKLEKYPCYVKGVLGQSDKGGWHYKMWMRNTYEWLCIRGFKANDYELHIPFVYNKNNFLRLDCIFKPISEVDMTIGQLAVRSVYGNLFLSDPPHRDDIKIRDKNEPLVLGDADCFSIGDDAFCGYILEKLEQDLPNKSMWEVQNDL